MLDHTVSSPAFLKCAFFAFLIRQLTTLYSGHMASESLTLLVIRFSITSGKWKVLLRMPGYQYLYLYRSTLVCSNSVTTSSTRSLRSL